MFFCFFLSPARVHHTDDFVPRGMSKYNSQYDRDVQRRGRRGGRGSRSSRDDVVVPTSLSSYYSLLADVAGGEGRFTDDGGVPRTATRGG